MLLKIKLFGGLVCGNRDLPYFGLYKFQMEVAKGITLKEIHQILKLSSATNLVSIVNGHAQLPEYTLDKDTTVSIFPPMIP